MTDRITKLRIRGLRAIEGIELDLTGLTVLIGENGTGKSSIIEALEILRLAAMPVEFVPDVIVRRHQGLETLLRRGSDRLSLGCTVEGGGPRIDYDFSLAFVGGLPAVVEERVDVHARPAAVEPLHALSRTATRARFFDATAGKLITVAVPEGSVDVTDTERELAVPGTRLLLAWLGVDKQPAFQRLTEALRAIELHVAFDTRPLWQQTELDVRSGPRWPAELEPSPALPRYGRGLPSAFQQLRNRDRSVLERIITRLRLGLDDVREFSPSAIGRGQVDLALWFGRWPDKPLSVEALSEGQIAYLAFVALVEMNHGRSVLAFDEPELHLHPALVARVAMMLEEVARECPVLLATHSDRLLDALADPGASVVLCELDGRRATRLVSPNPERLRRWLDEYSGLGSIRAAGYEPHVFDGGKGGGGGT